MEDRLFSADISLTALPTHMFRDMGLTCTPPGLGIEISTMVSFSPVTRNVGHVL
jgi:hypothetical protein